MSKFRTLILAILAGSLLVACDNWQRTNIEPVKAKVVNKYSRRPSKVPRRYYLVIEYEGRQVRIRARSEYSEKNIGDPYNACLITYIEQERKETRTELESCPIQ